MSKYKILTIVLSVLMFAMVATPTFAQYEQDDDWEFHVAPYLWVAEIDLDANTSAAHVSGNIDFGDIIRNLNGIIMTSYGAQKNKFSINGNLIFLGLKDDLDAKVLAGQRTTELNATFSQVLLGYDLFEIPVGDSMELTITPRTGFRYNRIRTKIDRINGGELTDSTSQWADYIVGSDFFLNINEKWSLSAGGTVGGFGWGSSSHLAWTAEGTVNYKMSEKSTIKVGYAQLDIDIRKGGADVDLGVSGPAIQYMYKF